MTKTTAFDPTAWYVAETKRNQELTCLRILNDLPEKTVDYINVEINPAGTAHVGLGGSRYGRTVFKKAIDGFEISTYRGEGLWALSFFLPWSFNM